MGQTVTTPKPPRPTARVVTSALAVLVAALAVFGVWWQSPADDRALREIAELLYARCLVDAATAPTPQASEVILERCDRTRRQAGLD